MLITAIVLVGVSAWRSARKLEETQQALRIANKQQAELEESLRKQTGEIKVTDPKLVHVRELGSLDEYTWRYRVFLPKGRYNLVTTTQQIKSKGFESGGMTSQSVRSSDDTQLTITVSIRKGADGEWQVVLERDNSTARMALGPNHAFNQPQRSMSWSGAGKEIQTTDLKSPLSLLRIQMSRVRHENGSTTSTSPEPDEAVDGVHVWLERENEAP